MALMRSAGGSSEVLGRIEHRRRQVVPDDHALGAADAGGEAAGRADAGRVEQRSIVRQLHEVAEVLARVVLGIHHGGIEERRRDVGDERRTRPLLADALERLVRLDLDRQIALTVPHEQVGLTDPVRLVVDREPTAGDDPGPGLHGLHGLPLPGVEVLGLDDDRALHTVEEEGEGVVLVLVAGPVEHLEEGRVGQRLTGLQHVELDALGAGLGEGGVPRPDLDGVHKGIVPGGRDTWLDQGRSPPRTGRNRPGGTPAIPPDLPPDLASWSEPEALDARSEPMESSQEARSEEPDTEAFRAELRAWLEDNLTPEVVEAGGHQIEGESLEVLRAWNRTLADGGWAAPSWPVEHGGRGAGVPEQLAYLEETNRVRAPGPVNVIGVSNIAPAIMQFGTPEQQERFLQPMLRGDEIWSQGMSEPDAGSDLASLRTAAVEDGDDFVINGQKTWNSLGHLADWCQLYVRTDPTAKKHAGITCFLVDLRTPGIEARPLTTITGGQSFAELFFTDARVPRSAMLGPLHAGWSVAMTTLSFERAGVARLHLSLSNRLDELLADPRAKAGLEDPVLRQRLAGIYADIRCMRFLTERSLSDPAAAGAGGSLAKLSWAHCDQELAALAVDLIGLDALVGSDRWGENLLAVRQASIAGGTTEINKNIIGEHVLGLPR